MKLGLEDRVVLVSGGSRGIGAAISAGFARERCRTVVTGRSRDSLLAIKGLLGDCCTVEQCDASDPRQAAIVLTEVASRHGRLDALVTCAGSGTSVPAGTETYDEWMRVLALNLLSATNMVEVSLPLLKKGNSASIVCVSSICGIESFGAPVTYSAAKAALGMAVKGWARALGPLGVRVNALSPGNILTKGGTWDHKLQADPEGVSAMIAREVPLGRFGSAEEIANAVLFLSSPLASFITGANLVVDGGQTKSA